MARERILFVTGRLAEFSLRRLLERLAAQGRFEYDVAVLGISVAALMQVEWLARKLRVPARIDRVVLPGWCQGEISELEKQYGVPVERGPKDLHDLPEYLGSGAHSRQDYGACDIEILAEINHAPRLSDAEIVRQASRYRESGADLIDLGTVPGESWKRAGEVTAILRREGFRVSIDSFERSEVESSVGAGAELVLSCNGTNCDWARELSAELVVIPDDPHDLTTLERTIDVLKEKGASFRLDPVLEPIGFGFAASLGRYLEVRRRWPDVEIMMGIGNLTELSEADSAGINLLLAGFCQEQRIRSVLTTEVINWGRSAVREFDVARRLAHYSVTQRTLPKHVDPRLVMLRDPKLSEMGAEELGNLASQLKDPNFRVFVERGEIHLMNRDGYWHGTDPYELFDRLGPLDPAHAFYLGYELSKAVTALTLGKQYRQDEALQWGFLTVPERSAHDRRRRESSENQ